MNAIESRSVKNAEFRGGDENMQNLGGTKNMQIRHDFHAMILTETKIRYDLRCAYLKSHIYKQSLTEASTLRRVCLSYKFETFFYNALFLLGSP